MKNVFLVLFALLLPLLALADPWEDLSKAEAEAVQAALKKSPYILDYCDCCEGEAQLLQVISTKIETCSYNSEKFSVVAKVRLVSIIPAVEDKGLKLDNIQNPEEDEEAALGMRGADEDSYIITMNYTWMYDKNREKGVPLYFIVPYKTPNSIKLDQGFCNPFTDYPTPNNVGDMAYKKWYKKNVKK